MAIRGVILNAGLFGTLEITPILATDKADTTVANRAHNELFAYCGTFNVHHNSGLVHQGNLKVVGNLTIQGATSQFEIPTLETTDPLLTFNKGGTTTTASGGGFELDNGGRWVYDPLLTNLFKIGMPGSEKEIARFNASLTLTAPTTPLSAQTVIPYNVAIAGASEVVSAAISSAQMSIPLSAATLLNLSKNVPDVMTRDTWVTVAANFSTAKMDAAAAGVQNYALSWGGGAQGTGGAGAIATTEIYTGVAAKFVTNLPVARRFLSGCGIANSALSIGGISGAGTGYSGDCNYFNGLTWSAAGTLTLSGGIGRIAMSATGRKNSSILTGGLGYSGPATYNWTERYNGTNWVQHASIMNSPRYFHILTGNSSNSLCAGGTWAGNLFSCERWGGLAWAVTTSMSMTSTYAAGCGTPSNTLNFKTLGPLTWAEKYNGFVWRTGSNLGSIIQQSSAAGTGGLASLICGSTGAAGLNSVSKYYGELPWEVLVYDDTTKTQKREGLFGPGYVDISVGYLQAPAITSQEKAEVEELGYLDSGAGTWSASTNLLLGLRGPSMFGVRNSATTIGGNSATASGGAPPTSGNTTNSYLFDGTTWSTLSAFAFPQGQVACGSRNSGLAATSGTSGTYEFDGTTWSRINAAFNISRNDGGMCGIRGLALTAGGGAGGGAFTSEKWNGTAWSLVGNMNTSGGWNEIVGNYTAACSIGPSNTEKWNGLAWSYGSTLLSAKAGGFGAAGVSNSWHALHTDAPEISINGIHASTGKIWSALQIFDNAGCGSSHNPLSIGGYISFIVQAPQVTTFIWSRHNSPGVMNLPTGVIAILSN